MKIEFELETLGYFSAQLSYSAIPVKIFHNCDYGNGFQDLLNSIFSLCFQKKEFENDVFPISEVVIWKDHFVEFHWKFTVFDKQSENILVQVSEVVFQTNTRKVLFEEGYTIDQLLSDIYESLHIMYETFGLIGFKKVCEVGNFPIGEFLILKSEKANIPIVPLFASQQDQSWTNKCDPNIELKLLVDAL